MMNHTCDKHLSVKEYTHLQEFVDNLPYILMVVLGAAIHAIGIRNSVIGLSAALLYVIYGFAGALWIMLFMCPYCNFFDTRSCPCGYGRIAAKFRQKSDEIDFSAKFKKHIPMIVPLWVIPVIVSIVSLASEMNSLLLILTIVFVINSYIVLPATARLYGCGHCPQKQDCPWMRKK